MPEARSGVMITTLVDNDLVRVQKITLKPGARTGHHGEGMPYVMIACNHGRTVRLDKEGKFLELMYLEPGQQWERAADFEHDVINVSDEDVHMLKMAMKQPKT